MGSKKANTKAESPKNEADIIIKEDNTIQQPTVINSNEKIKESSSAPKKKTNYSVDTPTPKTPVGKERSIKITKEKSRGKRMRHESFGIYIYKVLKQVHKDIGISKRSMKIMNSFIRDVYERLANESSTLVRYNRKHTLSAREIQSAVKLILPGELAKHAIIEGAKAVNKIASTQKN